MKIKRFVFMQSILRGAKKRRIFKDSNYLNYKSKLLYEVPFWWIRETEEVNDHFQKVVIVIAIYLLHSPTMGNGGRIRVR